MSWDTLATELWWAEQRADFTFAQLSDKGGGSTAAMEKLLEDLGQGWRLTGWDSVIDSHHDIAHELAHWMLTAPTKRGQRLFGLGSLGYGNTPRAQKEETRASLLGVLLEREHGLLYGATLSHHGWADSFGDLPEILDALKKRHLIDAEGRPTFCRAEPRAV